MVESRLQQEAETRNQITALAELREWNRKLKEIDERLELVWAPESVTAPGLTPGRFHVLRHNPGAPTAILVHETPEGGFLEPNSYLLEKLQSSDLWDDRVKRDREKRSKALSRAAEKEREAERESRLDEITGRLKARNNPGVLVTRDL
jgi:hypothetical protein